jgi:AmiR/NasT family two-component response regulator
MSRVLIERRLMDVAQRLRRAREELAVIDDQLAVLSDAADEARIRSLVSETSLAHREYTEAQRHADAMARSRQMVEADVGVAGDPGRTAGPPDQQRYGPSRDRPRSDGRVGAYRGLIAARTPATRTMVVDPQGARPVAVRVVIAEDEAIVRLDLKEIMEEEGYEVVGETGRGDEAVELVRAHLPDLAILDIKMPGTDGLTAAREINADRLCAVLILTAFSQRDLIEQARNAGALAYLVKPFQKSELLPAIEMAIGRFAEMKALDDQVKTLEESLEVRKAIDRAKGILMDELGWKENASFTWIRSHAMHERMTMLDIANQIIAGSSATGPSRQLKLQLGGDGGAEPRWLAAPAGVEEGPSRVGRVLAGTPAPRHPREGFEHDPVGQVGGHLGVS